MKKINYKEALKVLNAIAELEGTFKETGIHTKTIADYIDMDIAKVNAIVVNSWFSYFPNKNYVAINHEYKIIPVRKIKTLKESEQKLFTIGLLIEYKESLSSPSK